MYYNTEETGFATAYAISFRIRLALKVFSLISIWIAAIVLVLKVMILMAKPTLLLLTFHAHSDEIPLEITRAAVPYR